MPEYDFGVLSSPTRLEIYRALLKKPKSTNELARGLGLSHSSLRFHLRDLESAGLVVRMTETLKARGRPRILWKVNRRVHIGGFPVRHYEQLSDILLRTLKRLTENRKAVETALLEVGREMGEDMIRQITESKAISSWKSEDFCEHFIRGTLEGAGVVTEVEKLTEDEVVFSHFTCPFHELAERYKEEICDNLDKGFYEGIAEAMGGDAHFERTACIAHGDDKCSYILTWEARRASRGKAKTATVS